MYKKEGDYFIDRLNRMWVHEKPSVDAERWDKYLGIFFKRIEISDLLTDKLPEQTTNMLSIGFADRSTIWAYK
jgi:hypothetical protein